MITHVIGDILQSPARVMVNEVNAVGVMGRGLAHDFKLCYPAMFEQYRDLCERGAFQTGPWMLYRTPHKWVLNVATRDHWRAKARLEDIRAALARFVDTYAERGITSVAFPRLGCEPGGLDWAREVRPVMENLLAPLPVSVTIHADDPDDPFVSANERNIRSVRAWLEGDPQPVSFARFWRDISRLLRDNERQFVTVPGGEAFTVGRDTGRKRSGRSLVVLTGAPKPVFLSERVLADLWTYVRSAGYAQPRQFPGGLADHAPHIIGLLSALDYVRPVHLLDGGGAKQVGLHYVPPTIPLRVEPVGG